ncbi:hypothetical protein GGF32_004588 [Allomyces javanicus]|nr:hypothetical protein GGF32_004588 [Allomyces javanicus]
MEELWDYRGEEFFDQCTKFYNVEKDHVLHKVIAHNNIKVVAQLQSLNATTIMKMFNVYFGKRVLEQDKKHPQNCSQ